MYLNAAVKKERMISLFNFSDQEQVYELHILMHRN